MSKVRQTKEELQSQLDDQLRLLSILADRYDSGDTIVAKSMATSIRVLLHDTHVSHSLLGQLGLKKRNFFDTSSPHEEDSVDVQRIGSFCGLVGISIGGDGSGYVPYLDDTPANIFGFVGFDDYWDRVIFIDNQKNTFTRKEIVLAITNQDGGAHVDPNIEIKYKNLARENALGWKTSVDGKVWEDAQGSELAAIRQIAHELLRSFIPDYPKKKLIAKGGFVMGGMSVLLSKSKEVSKKIISSHARPKIQKVGRNEKCPCGSGVKYKRCHGK